jgi:hypothetical protein
LKRRERRVPGKRFRISRQIINAFFAGMRFDGRMKRRVVCNVIFRNVSLLNRFMVHDSTMQRLTLQQGCAFQLALMAGLVLMEAINRLGADL